MFSICSVVKLQAFQQVDWARGSANTPSILAWLIYCPTVPSHPGLLARITKMKELSKGSGRNHSLTILAAASLRLALGILA
jgi:hypothetical protein